MFLLWSVAQRMTGERLDGSRLFREKGQITITRLCGQNKTFEVWCVGKYRAFLGQGHEAGGQGSRACLARTLADEFGAFLGF
jgi:hypothetical protein